MEINTSLNQQNTNLQKGIAYKFNDNLAAKTDFDTKYKAEAMIYPGDLS